MQNSIVLGFKLVSPRFFWHPIRWSAGAWIAAVLILHGGAAIAADAAFEVFEAHNENSRVVIRYQLLDQLFRSTVYDVGPSHRWSASRKGGRTGSRIKSAKLLLSWLEGNRILFDMLGKDQISAVTDYLRMLQELPGRIEFSDLKRDEQLAYWLNLYNLTVYEHLITRYPMRDTKRLRRGSRKKPGLWDQKLLSVMGVPMSLNDIQNEILIPIWKSPVVLHGLFQGSIGGPSLRRRAYIGATVHGMLDENAEEFVNSIRGVHRRGGAARVSLFYDWIGAVFPNGESDLEAFLTGFADEKTMEILDSTSGLKATYFDWTIADIYNGQKKVGSMYAFYYGVGITASTSSSSGESTRTVLTDPGGLGAPAKFMPGPGLAGARDLNRIPGAELPPHAANFLNAMRSKYRNYGLPNSMVTVEDIEPGDDIWKSQGDSGEAPESKSDPER